MSIVSVASPKHGCENYRFFAAVMLGQCWI